MDAALANLATTAGTTLVKALATDGWEAARRAITALWRRHHPQDAELIEAGLESARTQLVTAPAQDAVEIAQDLTAAWLANLRALLRTAPEAADALREVLSRDLEPLIGEAGVRSRGDVVQKARADHGSITVQVGGDADIGKIR